MVYHPKPGEEGRGPRWFPNHVTTEIGAAIMLLAVMVLLSGYFTKGLGDPADPFNTPAHIKPEWYFLPLYQLLKLIPYKMLGIENFNKPFTILVSMAAILALILVPWIDRTPPEAQHPRKRPVIVVLFFLGLLITLALGIWGHF